MKKSLFDLYQSAGEAALKAKDLTGMALTVAKAEAFTAAQVHPLDVQKWSDYFDEQQNRWMELTKQPAPSAAAPAPAPEA